ncbi:hypothetical protein BCR41DRAFT_228183 [Lobosporangium transversale]|uniref:DUF3020 domain-containing protein n=1 Tax=Lobosporangium transversale TaxID=64571 RepID=A0A1Y2G6C9_9FUNG|nr:hypothetical protein BCR41DRAFT_228183 [Lobosporangium transversale]ORY97119.1 hypothetical protein BCR41DRAFT_228183 [Lobosporangium transversale]|eukprot:XP_021875652.1 hypothetical protein BCR41DRAFT_228183 [Lobosporangium transversale]
MSTELSGSTGNINSTPVAVPTPDAVESDSLNVPLIATVPVSVSPITAIVTPTTSTISATTPTVAAAGISELAALPVPTQTPEEIAKRNAINEKIRTENRERKKRWREANEDRNKDNDLRCRVNKRANKVFVPGQEEQKKQWIEEEFLKRQAKRKEKELSN